MFTKEELLVIEDALKIADEKYIKLLDESKNNKNKMVAFNRNSIASNRQMAFFIGKSPCNLSVISIISHVTSKCNKKQI